MSLYRNTVWFCKGLSEYTKGGFLSAAKKFHEDDLNVNCKGKSFMITGANSGLGKQTALEIAKRGGILHMVCRNPKTAEEAKEELMEATNNSDIHVHILDISQPKKISEFVTWFQGQYPSLDCLINNAGCMVNTREVTEDGLEKNFATNTLGTYILTELLIPMLEKSSDPRVIIVSSGGMLTQKLDLSDLQSEKMNPFDGTMVYAQNKRQQVVMARRLADKNKNIHFSSMHPGWADTPAVRSAMPDFYAKMKDKLRDSGQGADTIVWLAISDQARTFESGAFFQDRTVVSEHLPLAWTKASKADEQSLMKVIADLMKKVL